MRRLALLAACAALSMLLATGGVSAQTARAAPGLPTVLSATATGGSLTVTWIAPTDDGGAAITSYDLQYVEGDATDPGHQHQRQLDRTGRGVDLGLALVRRFWTQGKHRIQPCRCGPSTATGMGAGRPPPSPRRPPTTATCTGTATPAALGDDRTRNDRYPSDDVDFFSFTIVATTGRTDAWLYTTGGTNTSRPYLYYSSGAPARGRV